MRLWNIGGKELAEVVRHLINVPHCIANVHIHLRSQRHYKVCSDLIAWDMERFEWLRL